MGSWKFSKGREALLESPESVMNALGCYVCNLATIKLMKSHAALAGNSGAHGQKLTASSVRAPSQKHVQDYTICCQQALQYLLLYSYAPQCGLCLSL